MYIIIFTKKKVFLEFLVLLQLYIQNVVYELDNNNMLVKLQYSTYV